MMSGVFISLVGCVVLIKYSGMYTREGGTEILKEMKLIVRYISIYMISIHMSQVDTILLKQYLNVCNVRII